MTLRSEVSRAEDSTQGCRALRLESSVSVHQPSGVDSRSHMGPCSAEQEVASHPSEQGFTPPFNLNEPFVFEGKATQ